MSDSPVMSWTPNEAWFFAELARRALLVSVDGREPERVPLHDVEEQGARVRVELHATEQAITLALHLDGDRASVALAPLRVDGNGWRDAWALEVLRSRPEKSSETWLLVPGGAPALIEDARAVPLVVELRIKRRALVRHGETVPLEDVAFHRFTRQSSSVDAAGPLAWARPTSPETAPWWEIDLAKPLLVASLRIEIAAVPPSTRLTIQAFVYGAKAGGPPPDSFTQTFALDDLARDGDGHVVVQLHCEVIARFARVALTTADDKPVALRVTGFEALAGSIFAETLRGTLRRAFALHHDKTLFMNRSAESGAYEHEATYGEVWRRALTLGHALARRLEPATRDDGRVVLALLLRNGPDWVTSELAAVERGYVVVPISPDESDERLVQILERARPDAVICEAKDAKRAAAAGEARGLRVVIVCDGAIEGGLALAALLREDAAPAPEPAPRDEGELHSVLFTSGSTGAPKGAMRSYATFHAMLESYGAVQSPRHLSFQPLSHLSERMGLEWLLVSGSIVAFSRGGAHLMDELHAFGPTQLASVPRLFDVVHAGYKRRVRALLASEPETPLAVHESCALAEARAAFGPNLRSVAVGSAPVSPEVLAFMRRCFADLWVSEGYGTTEVGSITIDDKIIAGVDVKLVPEERGEIWVRTAHRISGYLGDEEATKAVLDEEGYFATGDLGERGADGAIRVVGRLRNAVKLAQGEFVSAERIESALVTAPAVDRVYVHAEGGAPGVSALVFPAAGSAALDRDAALAMLRGHGQRAGLAAWELPRGVLLELAPPSVENGLLTTSGKLARGAIAARYGARLAELASDATSLDASIGDGDGDGGCDLDLTAQLVRIAGRVLGRTVEPDAPLGAAGVDSLVAAELLAAIGDRLGREVPLALWFEVATLRELAARLMQFAERGGARASEALAAADRARVVRLDAQRAPAQLPPRSILLTGATGLLGAHLVEALLSRPGLHVTCLVRAADDDAARERLVRALGALDIPAPPAERVRVVAADLAQPRLGLDDAGYARLSGEIDAVLHSAAEVSWLASYEALRRPNVHGTLALLELAGARKTKPFHFISTISTAPADGDEDTTLPFAATLAGSPYGLTKWIAEEHVRSAGKAGLPVAVYRPAMIAAHSRRGHGNPDDFLHRYIVGTIELGLYLDLEGARLDMTPVDYVAEGIVALLVDRPLGEGTHHLVNVERSLSYAGVGRALRKAGRAVEPASYPAFRAALLRERSSRLSALASYFPEAGFTMAMGPWPSARTVAALESLGVVRPQIDDAMIARVLSSLASRGLL